MGPSEHKHYQTLKKQILAMKDLKKPLHLIGIVENFEQSRKKALSLQTA